MKKQKYLIANTNDPNKVESRLQETAIILLLINRS